MISVTEAEQIILSTQRNFGTELLPFEQALGRVSAENLVADRDWPPFNRVAMDGIAIRYADYESGIRAFNIAGIIAAGTESPASLPEKACFEIMTGAALPPATDTVIPYEHLEIIEDFAHVVQEKTKPWQNIHQQGTDKKQGDLLVRTGTLMNPVELSIAASIGKTELLVKKMPRVLIFSSGNELVEVADAPLPYQIRRSNNYAIQGQLMQLGIKPEMAHVPDDLAVIEKKLSEYMEEFDVIILSGGISMGKFDYIPEALESIGVTRLFQKVKQKPGKPFWFGQKPEKTVVFALPGNPVSTFLCMARYVMPWFEKMLGMPTKAVLLARLEGEIFFEPAMQLFIQVKLSQDFNAIWHARPQQSNGSGDYASLLETDAFLELPAETSTFRIGQTFKVWPFRQ